MIRHGWILAGVVGLVAMAGCIRAAEPRTIAMHERALCSASCERIVLQPASVERVEPLYSHLNSGPNGYESRLIGAKLLVKHLEGVTADELGQSLRCREARELLESTAANVEPYSVPNAWVDIQAKPEGGGYLVTLEASDFKTARQVLDRANAFVGAERAATCN